MNADLMNDIVTEVGGTHLF